MSIHYSPELVKTLMNENLREARRAMEVHCCEEPRVEPRRSFRSLFRRQSSAACGC